MEPEYGTRPPALWKREEAAGATTPQGSAAAGSAGPFRKRVGQDELKLQNMKPMIKMSL